MGAQAIGHPLNVGHGKGAAMAGIPHRLVHVAQVKGRGLESIVLLHRQGAKVGDVGQDQEPEECPGDPVFARAHGDSGPVGIVASRTASPSGLPCPSTACRRSSVGA